MGNKHDKLGNPEEYCEGDIATNDLIAIRDYLDEIIHHQGGTSENASKKKKRSSLSSDIAIADISQKHSEVINMLKDKILHNDQFKEAKAAWTKEREAFTSQANFLNSIIADQQKKIYLLEDYIRGMEKEISQDMKKKRVVKAPAPRLFCDICDVFDAHDTSDCPSKSSCSAFGTNEMDSHDDSSMSINVELFCHICEVFGHTATTCNDEETY